MQISETILQNNVLDGTLSQMSFALNISSEMLGKVLIVDQL